MTDKLIDNFDKLDKFEKLEILEKEEKEDFDEYVIEEDKFQKPNSLRKDNELFNDDDNIVHQVVSVSRVEIRGEETWEISVDKKIVLTLPGIKFTNKERSFFRTVDGIKYIISGFKNGWRTISQFKKGIK